MLNVLLSVGVVGVAMLSYILLTSSANYHIVLINIILMYVILLIVIWLNGIC